MRERVTNTIKKSLALRALRGVFVLLFILPIANVDAVESITWNGDDGIAEKIFLNSDSFTACAVCHQSSSPDFSPSLGTHAQVVAYQNNATAIADGDTPLDRINDGSMPFLSGGLPSSLQSLMSTWVSDGMPNNTAPHLVTDPSPNSLGKYAATFDENYYNDNGSNESYFIRYSTSTPLNGGNATSDSINPVGTNGGGGSGTGTNLSRSLPASGDPALACGTTYYYRLESASSLGATENFTTDACNQAPSFTSSAITTATEDTLYQYTFTVLDDGQGGTPTFSLTNNPTGMTIQTLSSTSGRISWTPINGVTSGNVTIRALDNGLDGAAPQLQSFVISVTPVNDSPVIGNVSNINGTEQVAISPVQAAVSDPDDSNNGSDLIWSLSNAPAGMSISTTGEISWTPAEGFVGPQTVTVQVCDGEPLCDTDTFDASASAVNDAPVISSTAPTSATEEQNYSYQVLYTDPDAGDSHTFALSNAPAGMAISATGLITWRPDDGDLPGTSNITVTVTDSGSLADSETFSITITPVNDQPQITSSPTTSVLEGALYSYQLAVNDPDDTNWPSDLTFYLTNEPAGMSIDQNGLLTWQTAEADPSPATITIGVRDDLADGTVPAEQTLNLTVVAYNAQPSITSTAPSTAVEDTPYTYQPSIDDIDDPNDGSGALSFNLGNAPTGMSISNTGLVTWNPLEGVTTSGTVTLSVSDGGEDSTVAATESFTIAVTQVNDAPSIVSTAPSSVVEMNTYSYQVIVSDPDDPNPVTDLSFSLANAPAGMTIDTSGLITWYAPEAAGTSGTVTLSVSDAGEDGAPPATENFTINVIVFNSPPTITSLAPTSALEDTPYQYQASVDDVDDNNDGSELSWSLANAPSGMSVSTTGLVTWTPTEGVTSSGNVSLSVSDGGEDGAQPATQNFTVLVTAVNDAPQIVSTPPSSVIQGQLLSHQVVVQDPDDSNNGSNLLFSLSGHPPGMLISPTGVLSWTPDESSPETSNISITVADGGEDAANAAVQNFALTVVFDQDQDGILNAEDNCPQLSNPDQSDNENDGIGDACDFDDDNDGMSDVFESANGFNPLDPSDASQDADGDGLSNREEFEAGTNPFGDDNPPHITLPLNNLWLATGYLTWVDIGQAVATDALDGPVAVSASRESGGFRPGLHEIIWTATDSGNNHASATQIIKVLPLIGIAPSQVTGEGGSVVVELMLNGDAPDNDASVLYSVGGSADSNDHNAVNARVDFVDGSAQIVIDITEDNTAEGEETLLLTLRNPVNSALSDTYQHEIRIVEDNHAPRVTLAVDQGGDSGRIINRVDGNVVISARVDDPNPNDTFSYDWSGTDNNLIALNNSGNNTASFEFSPNELATRLYSVQLTVSDSSGASSSDSVLISLQSSENALDADNNGIVDSADALAVPFALQSSISGPAIETATHLQIGLGQTARHVGRNGAGITIQDVENFGNEGFQAANALTPYTFDNDLFDFLIRGISEIGESTSVLLQQRSAIPENSVFRIYTPTDGWLTFVDDEFNRLSSAASVDGVCPPLGDLQYTGGLSAGHDCVQLSIQDGGPNDADATANAKVSLLGGVGVNASDTNGDETTSDGNNSDDNNNAASSGSGSLDLALLSLFLGAFASRYVLLRRRLFGRRS